MTTELTFYAASGAPRRPPLATHANERHWRAVRGPTTPQPPDDEPGIGPGLVPAQGWRAANRGLQRIEGIFAAVAFAGLLALVTLTFGYAFDGPMAAQATSVSSVAASR